MGTFVTIEMDMGLPRDVLMWIIYRSENGMEKKLKLLYTHKYLWMTSQCRQGNLHKMLFIFLYFSAHFLNLTDNIYTQFSLKYVTPE